MSIRLSACILKVVGERQEELPLLEEYMKDSTLVGEVGLEWQRTISEALGQTD